MLSGAATGEEFDPGGHKGLGELGKARLIADADEGSLDFGRRHVESPLDLSGTVVLLLVFKKTFRRPNRRTGVSVSTGRKDSPRQPW
jgi:hypothetical protein